MFDDLLTTAIASAHSGGAVLERMFRSTEIEVRRKAEHDLVSDADHASEEAVLAEIRKHHPEHRILSEEAGWSADPGSEYEWIVDPLDGTSNFLHGLPIFCVSVACRRGAELVAAAIYDPMGKNLYSATAGGDAHWNGKPIRVSTREGLSGAYLATGFPFRARGALDLYLQLFKRVFSEAMSIRRCGAAALDLAYTAAGVFDGFFEFRLSPWDIAAGALIVQQAGGALSDLDGGDRYLETGNLLAGSSALHAELLAAVREIASEDKLDLLSPFEV